MIGEVGARGAALEVPPPRGCRSSRNARIFPTFSRIKPPMATCTVHGWSGALAVFKRERRTGMSLQQALEVVKLQHVFWHKELCRAPEEELQDCELFRQQCELEIEILEVELEIPAIQRTRSDLRRRKPSEPSLSNAR